ncbi:hypothetical protein TNCV_1600481 [Trichonephila clavipes]|nr:hypothetical protein TNCV_1600481 [Trichonephila clavipes]
MDITRLPPPHYHPFLSCSFPRHVTSRVYLESFLKASWTAYEFGRTRGAFTETVELKMYQNIILNLFASMPARILSCIRARADQSTKTFVHLYYFQQ